jgi:predicted transposase YdaD
VKLEFDPTLKVLVDASPADWLSLLSRPLAPVSVMDTDLSAVLSAAADKFLRVEAPAPYILHLEFQAGHDSASLAPRLRMYNTIVDYRSGLPVRSVAVILRPEADSPQLTGVYERVIAGEHPHVVFHYDVIRIWQVPVERFLEGGLGTLPLAPISAVAEAELPRVIKRMGERLGRQERAKELWTATRILLGLRFPDAVTAVLLQGVMGMKESTTYQAIVAEGLAEGLAKGRVEGARRLLAVLGGEHLGEIDSHTRSALEEIDDLDRLERMAKGLLKAKSWQDLLGRPLPRRRNGRRKSTS